VRYASRDVHSRAYGYVYTNPDADAHRYIYAGAHQY
jgi:hypothetical protein